MKTIQLEMAMREKKLMMEAARHAQQMEVTRVAQKRKKCRDGSFEEGEVDNSKTSRCL